MDIFIHSGLDARVAQQLLEHLQLHPAFNRTGSISVSQSVHTETLDSVFITDFVKMGVIAAILTGLPVRKLIKTKSLTTSVLYKFFPNNSAPFSQRKRAHCYTMSIADTALFLKRYFSNLFNRSYYEFLANIVFKFFAFYQLF